MAEVEGGGRPQHGDVDKFGKLRITRRGHRMQVTLAKIELAMDGLIAVDRLLVLNQALENVLHDSAGGS
jgi:hypothetical protein